MSAGGVDVPAVTTPEPPAPTGDPVRDVNNAFEWSRDCFNRRLGLYQFTLAGMAVALGTALGG